MNGPHHYIQAYEWCDGRDMFVERFGTFFDIRRKLFLIFRFHFPNDFRSKVSVLGIVWPTVLGRLSNPLKIG